MITATNRRTKDYDLNLYGSDNGELILSAYRLMVDNTDPENPYYQLDTINFHHITFNAPQDIAEIEYLLGDLYLNQYPLTDYDDWTSIDLLPSNPPKRIADFLNSLPEYEMDTYK